MKGKKVIIIGGSSGIGLATAQLLIQQEAEIVIGDNSEEKLKDALKKLGRKVTAELVDITSRGSLALFFERITNFDHLVITYSETVHGNFNELLVEEAKLFFESKFWGPYKAVKNGIEKLKSDGSIVLFSVAMGQRPSQGPSCGSIINAAIETLVKVLAIELAPIRINCISPGIIDTPAWDRLWTEETKKKKFKEASAKLPVKRIGNPSEIADAVLFLLKNQYVTGATFFVDGGYVLVN